MSSRGFTLIELLICVTIASVLLCIAVPSYTRYTARSHRTLMFSELLQLATDLTSYHSEHQTYHGAPLKLTQADPYYRFKLTSETKSAYRLIAEAGKWQAQQDPDCQYIVLDSVSDTPVCYPMNTRRPSA